MAVRKVAVPLLQSSSRELNQAQTNIASSIATLQAKTDEGTKYYCTAACNTVGITPIATGLGIPIPFKQILIDPTGIMNPVTGFMVANKAGTWLIACHLGFISFAGQSTATYCDAKYAQNGTPIKPCSKIWHNGVQTDLEVVGSDIIPNVSIGDLIQINARVSGATATVAYATGASSTASWFSAIWIGD